MAPLLGSSASRTPTAFYVFSGAGALSCSAAWLLFQNNTDWGHVLLPTDPEHRKFVLEVYQQRHLWAGVSVAASAVNTALYLRYRKNLKVGATMGWWYLFNVTTYSLLYLGYARPELLLMDRAHNSTFVSTAMGNKLIRPAEPVIVTQLDSTQPPRCFPESQIRQSRIAPAGTATTVDSITGTTKRVPATMAYCTDTGTGIVYQTPPLADNPHQPRQFCAVSELHSNTIVLDKSSGHFGHQLLGMDETSLLEGLGEADYDKVGRRPYSLQQLQRAGVRPLEQVPTWRMNYHNFSRLYPDGKVFVHDKRQFPNLQQQRQPTKSFLQSLYDRIYDVVLDQVMSSDQHSPLENSPEAALTVRNVDDRLPSMMRVWGWNVGDSYVALTEDYVKQGKNGVRNLTVNGQPLVASYDADAESLGVWKRPTEQPIRGNVNVHGEVGRETLERLNTVKSGLFWFVWQQFFPETDVNPPEDF